MRHVVSALILLMTCVAASDAHEFWLRPASFTISEGGALRIDLLHGDRFVGSPVPRNNRMIERFELVHAQERPSGPMPVIGRDRSSASFVRADAPGVVVYQTDWYRNDLPAEKFEAYLREERLTYIAQERARLGESDDPGTERYMRCAKALLSSEDQPPADRWVGLPLEIRIETKANPGSGTFGTNASVRFRGEPIEGLRLVAVCEDSPTELIELVTDRSGSAAVPTDRAGVWMLTALHMARCDPGEDVEWESYWASLTFRL